MIDIAKLVQADIEARAQLGERKYGGRLTTGSRNNITSPLQNAYEEALDLCMYLRQEIEERRVYEAKGNAVTTMQPFTFEVPGEPERKIRHRTGEDGHTYNPSEAAEAFVQSAYMVVYGKTEPVPKVLFRLTCVFYTKNRQVKDIDNMWKLIADALQGLVWANDSQVWDMGETHREIDKAHPRTVVRIEEL